MQSIQQKTNDVTSYYHTYDNHPRAIGRIHSLYTRFYRQRRNVFSASYKAINNVLELRKGSPIAGNLFTVGNYRVLDEALRVRYENINGELFIV